MLALGNWPGLHVMDLLKKFFEQHFRSPAEHVQPLQGELGGSGRKIVRLWNDTASAIGILYGVREENAAFLSFSKQFRRHGLPVPEIYGEDLDEGALAGAVLADQRADLARLKRQVDAVERDGRAEPLGDASDLEQTHCSVR